MSSELLSQADIDALLQQSKASSEKQGGMEPSSRGEGEPDSGITGAETSLEVLDPMEKDALGEIGNISMGSAATALSIITNRRVNITTPQVRTTAPNILFGSFEVPYAVIMVQYSKGLSGSNLLILRLTDAAVIADLMMGGDGLNPPELGEMGISALAEAMNQMIGSSATSMSSIFQRAVVISPPKVSILHDTSQKTEWQKYYPWDPDEIITVVLFRIIIEDLVDSELLQVIPLGVARQEVGFLLSGEGEAGQNDTEETENPQAGSAPEPQPKAPEPQDYVDPWLGTPISDLSAAAATTAPWSLETRIENPSAAAPPVSMSASNLDLLLDVPLEVSVIMGRTKRPIREVLSLVPGSVVEVDQLVDEPIEILVNGTLVAGGEVVVVNENFGVRITHIISPAERLKQINKS